MDSNIEVEHEEQFWDTCWEGIWKVYCSMQGQEEIIVVDYWYMNSKIKVKCTCRKMEREGLPCCHILVVLDHLEFSAPPKCCILQRHSKNAKGGLPSKRESNLYGWTAKRSRYRNLTVLGAEAFDVASNNPEEFGKVKGYLGSIILPPFIYPRPICTWLKDQGKGIKSLMSLISRKSCERDLCLARIPKRRFSVFQCKNTNRPCINGFFRFWNKPWIVERREYQRSFCLKLGLIVRCQKLGWQKIRCIVLQWGRSGIHLLLTKVHLGKIITLQPKTTRMDLGLKHIMRHMTISAVIVTKGVIIRESVHWE
jgi:hypothetical protein